MEIVLGIKGEIALQIFCALMQRPDAKVTLYPNIGENEARISMALAETFIKVTGEAE